MVSPKLLTVYLRAAAREARDGGELSKRSRWAIDEATAELSAYRDVVKGLPPQDGLGYSLAVVQPVRSKASKRITDLFLTPSEGEKTSVAPSKEAERRIAKAMADLEDLKHGNRHAAERVLAIVSKPPGSPA